MRLGYQLTPILEAYGEAQFGRYWFDAPTQTTGQRADAETRSVKLGVSGSWNDVLTAHAAVGLGQYAWVYGPRSEETTRLYEAGVTYQPNPTLSVTGVVSTTIEPTGPDNGGTMRVVNKGQVSASYALNTSLSVTGDAEVARAHVEDNGEIEDRRAVGLSAEYGLSSKTKLAADYKYAHRDNSATGTFDSHQISLGVTLKR